MPTMLLISDLSNATDFEKYIKAHFIHKRTSKYVGCPECGSKLNLSYIRGEKCPLCGTDLKPESMLTNLTLPGEQVQVLIKKQHNTSSGRKYYANHKFFFIEHEYIVITKKPSGYEIAFVVPQHYTMDIRDSQSATWKDVVYAVLRQLGTSVSLDKIYEEIEPHKKAQGNPHWKAKVRQTLQMLAKIGSATHVAYGKWCVA